MILPVDSHPALFTVVNTEIVYAEEQRPELTSKLSMVGSPNTCQLLIGGFDGKCPL